MNILILERNILWNNVHTSYSLPYGILDDVWSRHPALATWGTLQECMWGYTHFITSQELVWSYILYLYVICNHLTHLTMFHMCFLQVHFVSYIYVHKICYTFWVWLYKMLGILITGPSCFLFFLLLWFVWFVQCVALKSGPLTKPWIFHVRCYL